MRMMASSSAITTRSDTHDIQADGCAKGAWRIIAGARGSVSDTTKWCLTPGCCGLRRRARCQTPFGYQTPCSLAPLRRRELVEQFVLLLFELADRVDDVLA